MADLTFEGHFNTDPAIEARHAEAERERVDVYKRQREVEAKYVRIFWGLTPPHVQAQLTKPEIQLDITKPIVLPARDAHAGGGSRGG